MVTRHEFLAQLHKELNPRFYLEIGVHQGHSLALATCPAWGIDPEPLVHATGQQMIFKATSDDFFTPSMWDWDGTFPAPLDLAFIDGMHLWEFALRDFVNIEKHSHGRTVVVFDDVLPYNEAIAARQQPPGGDWTGDVWKVGVFLQDARPDLTMRWVDTFPTGALVVWDLNPSFNWLNQGLDAALDRAGAISDDDEVPSYILDRTDAISAEEVINQLKESL